jgi:hypothetical protein
VSVLSPALFLPYLVLAIVVTIVAAWKASTSRRKWGAAIASLVFFSVFASIDDILGGIQHKWLCHKEAGFFVYKTAKLPPELFDANGKPRFISDDYAGEKMLSPFVDFRPEVIREYRGQFLKIDKHVIRVVLKNPEVLLGEYVSFSKWPSQFIPTLFHIRANRCVAPVDEMAQWHEWQSALFPRQ